MSGTVCGESSAVGYRVQDAGADGAGEYALLAVCLRRDLSQSRGAVLARGPDGFKWFTYFERITGWGTG